MTLSKAKSYLLTGTAGAVVPMLGMAGGSVATAADMAVKAPPPPPPVVASWTGCYIGGNIGVAGEHNFFTTDNLTADFGQQNTHNGSAFIGGGQAGCNWQSGKWVFGIEGDYSGLTKSNTYYFGQGPSNFNDTYGSHVSWMATARGRVGYAIDDGLTMLYLTGGAAWAGIKASQVNGSTTFDYSTTRTGWVVGGGVERIIFPHWTLGVEALYADFGTYHNAGTPEGKCCSTVHDRVAVGRVKLNFKF